MPYLPADIKDPARRREVLVQLKRNLDKKIIEMMDRRKIIEHELRALDQA